MFSFFAASFMWRLAGFFFTIIIYETLRYLVIDKVRQLKDKVKQFFSKKFDSQ